MRCLSEDKKRRYIDKELSKSEQVRMNRHLSICEKCRREIAVEKDRTEFFRLKLQLLYPTEVPGKIALPPCKSLKKRVSHHRYSYWTVAAVFLLAAVLFLFQFLMKTPGNQVSENVMIFTAKINGLPASTVIFNEKKQGMTVFWIESLKNQEN